MNTQRSTAYPPIAVPKQRLRWIRAAAARPRAAWRHILFTGQLGHYEDRDNARRTGARFQRPHRRSVPAPRRRSA